MRSWTTALLVFSLPGCGPESVESVALASSDAQADTVDTAGRWVFEGGGVVDGVIIEPARVNAGEAVQLRFGASGFGGVAARVAVLPGPAAARQEVATGSPGQPSDARVTWVDVELDSRVAVELPLGQAWHARTGVVVMEVRDGARPVTVRLGARSEMLADGTRREGGRAVLGLLEVDPLPTRVVAPRAKLALDGDVGEWADVPSHVLGSSMDGEPLRGPKEEDDTRVQFAWDDEFLWVAASLPDRDIWADLDQQDDPLWDQDVFELFLAGDNSGERYLELQVSARGTTFDAYFPRYRKGEFDWDSRWETAVAVDGDLTRQGEDRGWRAEARIPWAEICEKTTVSCPPRAGTSFRVNAFRIDHAGRRQQMGFALSPTRKPDFHAWDNAGILELTN